MKHQGITRFSRLTLAGAFAVAGLGVALLAGHGGSGPLATMPPVPGLAPASAEAAQTSACPRTLRRGDRGQAVRELQQRLNSAGGGPRLAVDGVFGARTLARVGDFQRDQGLVNDGVVGPETWGALGACTPPINKPPPR
jgi:peptidoglycan hydrolase-like protein with peptidoglycan-binding domain